MWTTILLLVFSSSIFSSDAQGVTNFEAQTVTDSTQANQGIKWDTTGPAVTLSIRDGRSNNANSPQRERTNQPLFYSNEWQPYLMPIGAGYGSRQPEDTGDDNGNYQFQPTLLRRPDSDINRTTSRQTTFNTGYGGSASRVPIPMAPWFNYPYAPSSAFLNENAYMTGSGNTVNNSSEPTPRSAVPESDDSNLDIQREGVPSPDFGLLPEDFERYPFDFYRTGNFFVPHPAFVSPYSILAGANENSLPPSVVPYVTNPTFERGTRADTRGTSTVGRAVPVTQKTAASGDIQERDSEVVNGTPSDASSTFVPPDTFRLPLGAYPFGLLPPPVLPNLFPIPPPTAGLPIQPLVNDVDFPKEGIIPDAVAAQPPVVPTNIPLEPAPGGLLPPLNTLVPIAELPAAAAAAEANVEGVPGVEEPASPAKIPYEFGFDMNDGKGTDQYRKEVSDQSGTVRGSYGYRDMFGVYRLVNYIADHNGFRAVIKSNEPGVASSGSANVVVMAEQPPAQAIAKGLRPDAIVVPDADLIAEGSSTITK